MAKRDEHTLTLLASEAHYFIERRGWTERQVAALLGINDQHVRHLVSKRAGKPAEFIPTPAEIQAGMDKYRPGHQAGFVSPVRSPAAILERVVEFRPDPRDDKEDAA